MVATLIFVEMHPFHRGYNSSSSIEMGALVPIFLFKNGALIVRFATVKINSIHLYLIGLRA